MIQTCEIVKDFRIIKQTYVSLSIHDISHALRGSVGLLFRGRRGPRGAVIALHHKLLLDAL